MKGQDMMDGPGRRAGTDARRNTQLAVAASAIAVAGVVMPARADTLEEIGDVMQIALPAAGGAATLFLDDKEGQKQWIFSTALNFGTQATIKAVVDKTRPNQGELSFPSGHTAAAFGGASFIQRRYGWGWGVPAYALAALTGYSRIDATAHDFFDVVGGATIGIFSTYIFTTPYEVGETTVQFSPILRDDALGLNIQLGGMADWGDRLQSDGGSLQDLSPDPVNKNLQRSTGSDPTEIRSLIEGEMMFIDQTGDRDPGASTVTAYVAQVNVEWALDEQQSLRGEIGYVWNDQEPFDSNGIGDIYLGYKNTFYRNDDAGTWEPRAMTAGIDTLVPSGSADKGTGFGAWLIRPHFRLAWTPIKNLNIYPGVSYYQSLYTEGDQLETQVIAAELGIEWKFDNGIYAFWIPEFTWDVSNNDTDFIANHRFQLGFPLGDDFVIYGEYALTGRELLLPPSQSDKGNRPRYYDDTAIIGIRYLF